MAQNTNETSNFHNGKPLNHKHDEEVQGGDFMPTINEETILRDAVPQNAQQIAIPTGPTGNGPMNFDDDDDEIEVQSGGSSAAKKSQEPEQTDAEKEEDSMALANGTVDFIIFGCTKAEGWIQVSEKKLDKLEKDGLIDKNMPVKLPNGGDIPVKQYVERFNESVVGQLQPKEDFREEVVPHLAKQFKKWGLGLSPGKRAAVGIGKYVWHFGTNLFELLGERKELINQLKISGEWYKEYVLMKRQESQPVYQQPMPQQQAAPYQQPMQPIQQQVATPQSNTTSVATEPSVTVIVEDGLPTKGSGVKRGRKKKE